ncbi:MAG TPA: pyruvate dehydrogenase (acetyl-transferring) E1 component subunit alpha [Nitrospiria bacterium]|nr:pyruvate dehydrogenase (acetyl-transferring) E1 component subunit alpha [Nitrospiria bacterium]
MPKHPIREFSVQRLQILNEQGQCDTALLPPLTDKDIQSLYEWMVISRVFDERALVLQREGRLGTYASILGQEATQVGSAYALTPADWIFPAFREIGVALVRGVPMTHLLAYWSGDERGGQIPPELRYFTIAIPVGTHIPHAVGAAWAAKIKKDPVVIVAYFGDGATSKGDFHEGMNFAGVFKLPIIFICQNNQWAISVPRTRQTASATLAQKAIAYGFEGIQVDGNDVFSVYSATRSALERARAGGGPALIECVTYRMGDHTTADDASRYRPESEVAAWRAKDPIERLKKYMQGRGLWDPVYGDRIATEANARVNSAVTEFEALPPPDPADMIRYTYEALTRPLEAQMEELRQRIKERPPKKEK